MNKHYIIQIQSRSDYGTKIKEEPQMRQRSLIDPNWAPLLINWKRNNTKEKIFIELLLELGCVLCSVTSTPANWFWKYL